METVKLLFSKLLSFVRPLWNMFNRQTKLVKVATSISFGIGFLCIKKLFKNYNYNKKQFELTPKNISSKAILITGCGSGIGKATAYKLNKLGFIVIATCRRQESVDKYLSDNDFTKNGSTAVQLDIASNNNVLSTKDKIKTFLTDNNYTLWGLVNNAGILDGATPFEFYTHDSLKKHVDVNVYGTMNMCHEFVPLLYGRCSKINGYKYANGGRIVNVSSISAKVVFPAIVIYSATKIAVSHFSHGLRIELSPRFGIWCSAMEIGAFKTNMTDPNKIRNNYNILIKSIENRDNITTFYDMNIENDINEKLKELQKATPNPNVNIAVDDIIHSLTAKYPKRTYHSGVSPVLHIIIAFIKKYKTMERIICCGDMEAYSK